LEQVLAESGRSAFEQEPREADLYVTQSEHCGWAEHQQVEPQVERPPTSLKQSAQSS
jgi:hypothetical protein